MKIFYCIPLLCFSLQANEYTDVRVDMDNDKYLRDELKNVFHITNPQLVAYATPILERKLTERGKEALHNADVLKKYMSEAIEESFVHKEIEAGHYKINSENNIRKARIAACTNIVTCLITAGVVMAVQFSECGK